MGPWADHYSIILRPNVLNVIRIRLLFGFSCRFAEFRALTTVTYFSSLLPLNYYFCFLLVRITRSSHSKQALIRLQLEDGLAANRVECEVSLLFITAIEGSDLEKSLDDSVHPPHESRVAIELCAPRLCRIY